MKLKPEVWKVDDSAMEEGVRQRRAVKLVLVECGQVKSSYDPEVRSQVMKVSVIKHGEGWSSLEAGRLPLHHLMDSLGSQALGGGFHQVSHCLHHSLVVRLIAL